jgi:acetyltransferase-like isoleucine patch superfamily enzyme
MNPSSPSLFSMMKTIVSGVRRLADPSLVRWLGERANEIALIETFRNENPTCFIDKTVVFYTSPSKTVRLGRQVRIAHGSVFGCDRKENEPHSITIGDLTYIGDYTNFRSAPDTTITIGREVLISQFCSLVAANHSVEAGGSVASRGNDMTRHSIKIGDGAWLGAGSTVLPGVEVGAGAVVGANSVVTANVPPNEIWAGSPAKMIGRRE